MFHVRDSFLDSDSVVVGSFFVVALIWPVICVCGIHYSKTCVKWQLKKLDETKILTTNGSLMKVQSIAFCNTFDLH